jgi:hypothetical protein
MQGYITNPMTTLTKKIVEASPDWFEEITEPLKDKIKKRIYYVEDKFIEMISHNTDFSGEFVFLKQVDTERRRKIKILIKE